MVKIYTVKVVKHMNKQKSVIILGTDQLFTEQVRQETRSIGIQCDILAAAPLPILTSKPISVEASLSTDTEEAGLNTSFQLTHEDTTTE